VKDRVPDLQCLGPVLGTPDIGSADPEELSLAVGQPWKKLDSGVNVMLINFGDVHQFLVKNSANPSLFPSPQHPLFPSILFLSTTVLTRMTGISLPVAMASDFLNCVAVFSKRTIVFFVTDQTPCPYPTRSLPVQF
jgi:hypothetical protein